MSSTASRSRRSADAPRNTRRAGAPASPARGRSAVAVAALCLALAGCSAANEAGGATAADVAPSAVGQAAQPHAADGAAAQVESAAGARDAGANPGDSADAADALKPANPAAADSDRKIARTATLSVQVDNLDAAGQAVRVAASAVGGEIVSESWDLRAGAAGQGAMTLSVPAAQLAPTMQRLEALGTVKAREGNATDVTGTFVDTQGRLATMRASVARVRDLMDRARTVRDVIELEKALATREAELEALERRLAALTGSVENATITLSLLGPEAAPPATSGGFRDGLQRGLDALVASAALAVTALGVVLPWLLPLALLFWAARWALRRRAARTRRLGVEPQPGETVAETARENADAAAPR